jgi:hypothetical protein
MAQSGSWIEACLVFPCDGDCGLDLSSILPCVTTVVLKEHPEVSTERWLQFGFLSEEVFVGIRHRVDLVLVVANSRGLGKVDWSWVGSVMEEVCGMGCDSDGYCVWS